jgi:hypothetical protein
MRFLVSLVVCFVFLVGMGDCWMSLSLMSFKLGSKLCCNDRVNLKKIVFGRYAKVHMRSTLDSSENQKGKDEENQNGTSAGQNLFPFSDWSQFIPGNLTADDAAAAGVLGMMRRAMDAGKQANQDSAAANGGSSRQVNTNYQHFVPPASLLSPPVSLSGLQGQGGRDAESPLPVQLELEKARAELAEVAHVHRTSFPRPDFPNQISPSRTPRPHVPPHPLPTHQKSRGAEF